MMKKACCDMTNLKAFGPGVFYEMELVFIGLF